MMDEGPGDIAGNADAGDEEPTRHCCHPWDEISERYYTS